VPSLGTTAKLLLRLALLSGCFLDLTLLAQQPAQDTPDQTQQNASIQLAKPFELFQAHDTRPYLMPGVAQSYFSVPPRTEIAPFEKPNWSSSTGTIQRMESAFYCNDTPFVDQVRFPLATLWHGRVKLVGFESDVTTANFVLGLPGQGALHNLSAFGNAFIATHTPPSDQLAGINMVFSLRANNTESSENSGLRGIEYLMHAGRSAFLSARAEVTHSASR
jgi:hypothetical protein